MKKKTALIISIAIFLSILSPGFSAYNKDARLKNAISFCDEVRELNKRYQALDDINITDENNNTVYSQYENRLIVKTKDKISSNAVESVTGLDYTILQYNTKEALNKDYEILKKKGYSIQKDNILKANDLGLDNIEAYSSKSAGDYRYAGVDYALKHFENSGIKYDDITVGIIDTGIYYNHEIYNGRYIENNVNFSSSGDENDVLDDNGHGTAVSSIVIMSTPDNVKVKGYKTLDSEGTATMSSVLSVIEYIIAEKDRPDIVNMSLGGYDLCGNEQSIMKDALTRLIEKGTIVCAAAGNEFVPAEYSTIGGCEEVITVASHGDNGQFSDFSDYGSVIDITAPGENITCAKFNTVDEYTSENMTGTSVACPFVAAACAYILMQHPDYTVAQAEKRLKDAAVKTSIDDSYYFGSGVLCFSNLIEGHSENILPDKSGGEYDGSELTISFDVPQGKELYYALNSNTGRVYTPYSEPITLIRNSTISYALMENGELISDICSQSYELNYTVQPSDITISLGVIKEINAPDENINVIIPNGIGGKRPTSVYSLTFQGKRYNKVTLPDTVTTLGTSSFTSSLITEITAKGVTKFSGEKVFYNCKKLKSIDMPKLETVTESAFEFCESLNFINFGENITKLKTRLFAYTSIINGNFPKADYPVGSCIEVFQGANIFTCNLPKIDTLNESIFKHCNYLYQLNTKPIKTIYSNALYSCGFIKEMDLSNLTNLYKGAMAGMCIEHFYAPKVTSIKESATAKTTSIGGYLCHCEIIEFPNLSGELGSGSIYYSSVKTIILPKITKLTSNSSIYNTPVLKIVYLPNVTEYYSPKCNLGQYDSLFGYDVYSKYAKPELVFIPKAVKAENLIFRNLGTIYAPSATSLSVTITEPVTKGNIILSEKIEDNGVTVTCDNNELIPNVIAPSGKSLDGSFNYTDSSHWKYEGDENGTLIYSCNDAESRIPLDFIKEFWSINMINKSCDKTHSLLFDFQSDNIINAKDFAIYNKLINN